MYGNIFIDSKNYTCLYSTYYANNYIIHTYYLYYKNLKYIDICFKQHSSHFIDWVIDLHLLPVPGSELRASTC
jgi:hypothetical protein